MTDGVPKIRSVAAEFHENLIYSRRRPRRIQCCKLSNYTERACACLFNFGNVLFLLTFRFILSSELQESVGTSTIVLLIRVYI